MGLKPVPFESQQPIRNAGTTAKKRAHNTPIRNMSAPPTGPEMPVEAPVKNSVQTKGGRR